MLQARNGKHTATLVIQSGTAARRGADKGEALYTISRPNTGLQLRQESLQEIKKKSRKVTPDEAEPLWNDLYHASKTECLHSYWFVFYFLNYKHFVYFREIFENIN